MNKIIVQFGLLMFLLSIVFFLYQGLSIELVIVRALIVFVVVSISGAVLAIAFMKAINNAANREKKI